MPSPPSTRPPAMRPAGLKTPIRVVIIPTTDTSHAKWYRFIDHLLFLRLTDQPPQTRLAHYCLLVNGCSTGVEPAKYVLEVSAGFADKNEIKIGDAVAF